MTREREGVYGSPLLHREPTPGWAEYEHALDQQARYAERDLRRPLCDCGHTSHWHSHDGHGDCEHDADCRCDAFRQNGAAAVSAARRQDPEEIARGNDKAY